MKPIQDDGSYPGRKILRRMGLLRSQKGILNRYFRESAGWEKHLSEARKFILRSARGKKKGTAAILGSGWLLDIPLEELTDLFERVRLYDLNHPPQIRKKAEGFDNVELIQADLTGGGIEQSYRACRRYKQTGEKTLVNALDNKTFGFEETPDFIVSLNIMNQLNILIREYLRKKRIYTDRELLQLDRKIQQDHLNLLAEGKSCLITDYEEEMYDKEGNFIGSNPLIHVPLPEGNFKEQWQWKFDTRMYYRRDAQTLLNVIALDL
jgi:hypothetical protein